MAMNKALQRIKNNFNLNSVDQIYFWKSEWERFDPGDKLCNVSIGYLIYRFLFMSYFIASTATNIACAGDINLYLIFLTNWTFALQLIYSVLYFFRLLWIYIQRRKVETRLFSSTAANVGFSQQPILPWPEKVIWILLNIVVVLPYGVTFGYYSIVFDKNNVFTPCRAVSNYVVHAINSPMALLDSLVIAIPIRFTHMIFPIIVSLVYCIFSGMYEVAGGVYPVGKTNIYGVLDWKKSPGWATLGSIAGIIAAAFGHLIFGWSVYRLRLCITNIYLSSIKEIDVADEESPKSQLSENVMGYANPILVGDSENSKPIDPKNTLSDQNASYNPEPQNSSYQSA